MSEKVRYNRWLILAAACLLVFVTGANYTFAVWRESVANHIGGGKETLAAVMNGYAISSAISPIPMILGGYFVDKGYARWVAMAGGVCWGLGWIFGGQATSVTGFVFWYAFVGGLGLGFAYTAALSNTLKFFPDRRGMAAGLITGVNGGATIVLAPVVQSLLGSYDVSTAMMIMGVLFVVVGILVAFVVKPAPAGYKPEGWEPPAPAAGAPAMANVYWKQMLRTPMFWLIFFIFVSGAFAGHLVVSNAAQIVKSKAMFNITENAALYVSLFALASLCGRIGFGTLSDKIGTVRTVQVTFGVTLIGLLAFKFGTGDGAIAILIIGIVCVGGSYGGVMGTMPAMVMAQFGPKNQGINYGLAFVGFALSAYLASMYGANVFKNNGGDLGPAFTVAIVGAAVGLAIALYYQVLLAQRAKKEELQKA